MPRHYVIATALLACAVAACTPTPDEQQQALDQAEQRAKEVAQAAPAAPEVSGACDDSQAQWAIGKTVTDADVEQARTDAGAESARTIGPDQMVTMDFNDKRLNLDTDAKGVVTAVRCG